MKNSRNNDIPSIVYLGLIFLAIFLFIDSFFITVTEDSLTIVKLVFSSEAFVATIAGIAAIYSWKSQRKVSDDEKMNTEYENNLQMLKDIDGVLEYYKDQSDERNVLIDFQDYLSSLSDKFSQEDDERDKFLKHYYTYVSSKAQPSEEKRIFSEKIGSPGDDVNAIKHRISENTGIAVKNIRFSKVYPTNNDEFLWTTWFNLKKSFIENLSDLDQIIFFTKVNGNYEGAKISSEYINVHTEGVTPRNSKNNDKQYDFYISKKNDGTYYDHRNDKVIRDMKEVDLSFLNNN